MEKVWILKKYDVILRVEFPKGLGKEERISRLVDKY